MCTIPPVLHCSASCCRFTGWNYSTPSVHHPRPSICGPFDRPIRYQWECLNLAISSTPQTSTAVCKLVLQHSLQRAVLIVVSEDCRATPVFTAFQLLEERRDNTITRKRAWLERCRLPTNQPYLTTMAGRWTTTMMASTKCTSTEGQHHSGCEPFNLL